MYCFKIPILVAFVILRFNYGQTLEAVLTNARLPTPRSTVAVFDADNSIYTLGGIYYLPDYTRFDEIVRVWPLTDEVEIYARFPHPVGMGTAVITPENKIYYFGGSRDQQNYLGDIWELQLGVSNPAPVRIGNLPTDANVDGGAYDGIHFIAVIGGGVSGSGGDELYLFNTNSSVVERAIKLPSLRFGCTAAWFGDLLFIFGGSGAPQEILVYHKPSNSLERLAVDLPTRCVFASAVTDGRYIYLLFNDSGPFRIIKFNPLTYNSQVYNVTNLYNAPFTTAVLFKPTNKIYILGGYYGITDEIYYVDISSM